MKHLFFIHSHTLFLTALGVVEYLHLNEKDVIFIYSRHYKSAIPISIKTFDLSKEIEDTFYIMLSWSRRNFFYNKKQREKSVIFFDDFVKENVGDDKYRLYVPHVQLHVSQIMATNKQCEEMFFIQEGGRAMLPLQTGRISLINRLYNKLVLRNDDRVWKCSNWFPNKNTPYSKPVSVFAFSPNFFGNAPNKIYNVRWPRIKINIPLVEGRPIFLFEGAVELGQVKRKIYMSSVSTLIKQYAGQKNYIKFHPMQGQEARESIFKIFSDLDVEAEELPMDVPFELIVSNYHNLQLYGFGTSLLFYGKSFGHHVESMERLLMKSWRYRIYLKGLQSLDDVVAVVEN